ncbi:MAG: hypothetical protein ACFCVH_05705 [Alphaproteobacteria bacterium]
MLVQTLCAAAVAIGLAAPALGQENNRLVRPFDPSFEQSPDMLQLVLPPAFRGLGCTFYADANGGGESWRVEVDSFIETRNGRSYYGATVPWVGHAWNDRISSIRCGRAGSIGCYPVVYRDAVENQPLFAPTSFGVDAGDLIELSRFGMDNAISALSLKCG